MAEGSASDLVPESLLRLGLLALALGLPAALFALRRFHARPAAPREGAPALPVDLLLAVPLLLLSQLAVVSLLGMWYGGVDAVPILANLAAVPLFLTPLASIAVLRAAQARTWRPLGLGLPDEGATGAALVAWMLFLPLLYGLVWSSPTLYQAFGLDWAPQEHALGIATLGGSALALAAVLAVVVVPCFEEFVFRGWLQQGLARTVGPSAGIGLTAALFTINHDSSVWLPILVLALLLGLLRERTQRLWPCLAVHMAHNGVQVALLVVSLEVG